MTNYPPFRAALRVLACAVALQASASANTVLNTFPDFNPGGSYTNGFLAQGQTFVVPVDTVLSDFSFRLFNAPGQSSQMQIFAWGATGPTGAALYSSPSLIRNNTIQDVVVSNINLTLSQGALYGAVISNFGYSGPDAGFNQNQNSYTGGNMWLLSADTPTTWTSFGGLNLTFQATFVSAGASSGVPEPGAAWLMSCGLAGLFFVGRAVAVKRTSDASATKRCL